ncbi:MAG: phosphate/phosphite/phosphonate ABC transporter substrate-binding protein [Caldilineaceae bacterium]|nr:phosphate/phosphite/phosphonate ABC transporter substrate-binding protein [Caldilineaceae bacterium]
MRHTLLKVLLLAAIMSVVSACAVPAATAPSAPPATAAPAAGSEEQAADPRADWPEVFRLGLFGGDDADEVVNNAQPLRLYLEEQLGIPVEVFTGTSYSAVIEAMRADRVDAMSVGPFSYTLAVQEAGAEAIAVGVSTRAEPAVYDPTLPSHYYSVIFTKKGSGIESFEDLRGVDFTFVDPASTSGHLAPKTLLIKNGLNPDEEMNTVFAGSHPSSVIAVWNDKARAGATFENNLYRLRDEGQIDFCGFEDNQTGVPRSPEDIRALYESCPEGQITMIAYSDPIPNTPFAVRSELPDSFKQAVKDALLAIKDNEELVAVTARWYVDPSEQLGLARLDHYYNPLRDIAQLLDLDLHELE